MELKYSALLSPIKIGNMVLRNGMLSSASTPHFLQGTEKNPTEKVIQHFANRAKNGAALVTINHLYEKTMPVMGRALDNTPCHFNLFDLNDATHRITSVSCWTPSTSVLQDLCLYHEPRQHAGRHGHAFRRTR